MKSKEKIYLMGIAGTAMASLAGLLQDLGFETAGSDAQIYPPMSTALENLGIEILTPYSPDNLMKTKPDWVVIGNVISENHPEAQYVLSNNIKYLSLPQALEKWVFPNAKSLVVAGTHGKTTTTSILAHCLQELEPENDKPGFLIGGIAQNFGKSFQNLSSESGYFAIEGDEYDTAFWEKTPKFLHYRPHSVILTSIEFDHADIYKDLEEIKLRFIELLELVPKDGYIIACQEDPNVLEVIKRAQKNIKANIIYYGFENQKLQSEIENNTNLTGLHNLLNSLGVFKLLKPLGFEKNKILDAFKTFKGIKRRMEIVGETKDKNDNQIIIIDDFAHHPTAVKTTLEGTCAKYRNIDPNFQIWALFEPRSATSCTNLFQQDYANAFGAADKILIAPTGRQNIEDPLDTHQLAQDLKNKNLDAQACDSIGNMINIVTSKINTPTVLLCMSNGAFGGIHQKLLKELGT